MKRILLVTVSCLLSVISFLSVAAEPRQEPTDRERARTVYIFHQPIVMLQAKFGLTTPEERVLRIRNTLRNFSQQEVREPLKIIPVTRYNQPGRLIVMNGKPVMLLAQADLDEGDDLTLDEAAQRVLTRMEAQRTALRDQYDAGWLALSAGKTAAGLLALFVFWYGAWRSWRGVRRFYRGRILENLGMLATKIITRENYVVTVPNAVVVSGKITNLSAQNPDGGVNLTTGVTIGYDTPWRQVHAMLEIAARRAKCIDQSQQPLVRQLSLMDWYIAYELQVKLRAGQSLAEARNELHSNIQDVFNEFNVQIMSPNFVMQPEGAVVVTEDNWYAAPAEKPENKQRE